MICATLGLLLGVACAAADEPARPTLERSYWVHASLAPVAQQGYWGPEFPLCTPPNDTEILHAAELLAGRYAANRLYLVYHHEMPPDDALRVFRQWRRSCPARLQLVPTLLLRMYDRAQSEVFTPEELRRLVEFFRQTVSADQLAVYDVYARRDQGAALQYLAEQYPRGLIRVGIQPDEKVRPPFVAAVQDTWSGFCHGKSHADWEQRGFGADTLARWVQQRNQERAGISWDLIVVAWDYSATERGEYPGYDDAARNMPLPAGRNRLAAELILRTAAASGLAGFSSDLLILQANSRHPARDGANSFYHTLRRGEEYRGYYAQPLREIAEFFTQLRQTAK